MNWSGGIAPLSGWFQRHGAGACSLTKAQVSPGIPYARTDVILLVQDLHVTVIHAATGEVLRDLIIDPRRDYQPTGRPPGPPKR